MVMVQLRVVLMLLRPTQFHLRVVILDVQLIAKKHLSKDYRKALLTLGDHIRKKRLDLNLLQTDTANIMNVDEMTIVGCELNHCQPFTRYIPRIIDFHGYVLENLFLQGTIGHKIKRYRLLHGLTRK